jgi:hypothetical protein
MCSLPLALAGCGTWSLDPQIVPKDLPEMPAQAVLDYQPMRAMAHAALPLFDAGRNAFVGSGRVWVKGSQACQSARIVETGQTITLQPPYYTAVVEAPAGDQNVEFETGTAHARMVQVTVPDAARLNTPGADFSALFVGDFQPFVIAKGHVQVNPGTACGPTGPGGPQTTLVALRRMLQAAAEGELRTFPKPAFTCGVGDQVYVEGDYHSFGDYGQRHPMSAWTVEAQPRPRVGLADLPRFLDTCYRGHWSFTTLERVLRACPSLMIWDDHDIRDGWGSQGDEHVYRDSYFQGFRTAFVEHQFRRGPRAWNDDLVRVDAALWQTFAVAGVPAFVLDLRTCRDVSVPVVIGAEQWRSLRQWFAGLDPVRCRHYVLVSSMPLFYRVGKHANIAAAFSDEVRDDLLDTWTSTANEAEWRQLIEEIAKAASRGLRGLIVSGDYHVNSLCRVTSSRDGGKPEVIAYELIASGLASDSYGDWKQRLAREGWFAETPIDVGGTRLVTEFSFIEPCPSFGGLEFTQGEVTADIFQANADGCFQQRVPLSWGETTESLSAIVTRSRVRIDPAELLR